MCDPMLATAIAVQVVQPRLSRDMITNNNHEHSPVSETNVEYWVGRQRGAMFAAGERAVMMLLSTFHSERGRTTVVNTQQILATRPTVDLLCIFSPEGEFTVATEDATAGLAVERIRVR